MIVNAGDEKTLQKNPMHLNKLWAGFCHTLFLPSLLEATPVTFRIEVLPSNAQSGPATAVWRAGAVETADSALGEPHKPCDLPATERSGLSVLRVGMALGDSVYSASCVGR